MYTGFQIETFISPKGEYVALVVVDKTIQKQPLINIFIPN